MLAGVAVLIGFTGLGGLAMLIIGVIGAAAHRAAPTGHVDA